MMGIKEYETVRTVLLVEWKQDRRPSTYYLKEMQWMLVLQR